MDTQADKSKTVSGRIDAVAAVNLIMVDLPILIDAVLGEAGPNASPKP